MAKTTADGKTAIRVREHAGNTWLIRTQTQTHLTEIPAGVAIEDYDDSVWPREFYAPARAWRLYHDEIDAEMRRNGVKPGWYVETPSYGNIGPFARRDEAEGYLKRYAVEDMGRYFAPAKNEPVKLASGNVAEPVLVAGTVYRYSKNADTIWAYVVDTDHRWWMERDQRGIRFTQVPAGMTRAQERSVAPSGAVLGYLTIMFREGASFAETEAAQGLTLRDILADDGRPRHDVLPRFARLVTVTHLWLNPVEV